MLKNLVLYTTFIIVVLIGSQTSIFAKKKSVKEETWTKFGIELSTGTTGIGGGLIWSPNPYGKFFIRLEYEKIDLSSWFDSNYKFNINDVSIENQIVPLVSTKSLSSQEVSVLINYQFTNWFYSTLGLVITDINCHITAKTNSFINTNDIYISPETMGELKLILTPKSKVTPYLGIGFGNTLSIYKRLSFSLEIGAYYLGTPELKLEATGGFKPSTDPAHQKELNEKIRDTKLFYPVARCKLALRLF